MFDSLPEYDPDPEPEMPGALMVAVLAAVVVGGVVGFGYLTAKFFIGYARIAHGAA